MKPPGRRLFSDDPALRRLAFSTSWGFLATGFGSGLIRGAPGTAGTVVAVPIAIALATLPTDVAVVVVLLLFLAGIPLCRAAAAVLSQSDPGAIVWDEIVGFCLVAVLIPAGWAWLAAAFLVFRLFDIFKPWPIRRLERHVGGGFGIMIDDVVAALFTVIVLGVLRWALN